MSKTIFIRLLRSELIYDIANVAFVEADSLKTEDEHERHTISDIAQDGNIDLITRYLDLAYSDCEESLYAFTHRDIETGISRDDRLIESEVYEMSLQVADDFSETTHNRLLRLIHEFMVAGALARYFLIVYPTKARLWQEHSEVLLQDINSTKNKRSGRVRRTQTPF